MTGTGPRSDRTGALLTALSAAFFGSLAVYGKAAERLSIPLLELLAMRFGIAALLLWVLAILRHERLWWGRRSAALALMGALYVGQALTYFTSLRTVPAAVTSILLYVYPVIVMVLAALFLGERIGRTKAMALGAALLGVLAIVDPFGARGSIDAAGVAFGLATAAIYATYILTGRLLLRAVPPVVATATIATAASAILTVSGAASGQLHALNGAGYGLAASMAVVATAIPATLFLAGLARVGATRAAIISTLEPATTVVLAAILLGERLSAVRLAGGAIILGAAIVVARSVPPDLAEPPVRE